MFELGLRRLMTLTIRHLLIGLTGLLLICALPAMAQTTSKPLKTLYLGVVVGDNVNYRIRRMEPFRAYLQEKIGLPVAVLAARNYQLLIEAQQKGQIHYAVYSAAAYVQAWATCRCIEPLAAPKSLDGGHGIYSVLLVAAQSSIHRLEDLDQKRVLYTGPSTLAGHLIPARAMSLLSDAGQFVFGDADVVANAEASLGALLDGTASGIFGWKGSQTTNSSINKAERGTIAMAMASGLIPPGFTRAIWRSQFLPHGPHAVLESVPDAIKQKLRQALIELNPKNPAIILNAPEFSETNPPQKPQAIVAYSAADIVDAVDFSFGGGFAPIGHYDYLPVLNILGWGSENTVPDWP